MMLASLILVCIEAQKIRMRSYVEEIFDKQGLIHPLVKDRRDGCAACFAPHDYTIRLPTWSRTLPVVLHEHGGPPAISCGLDGLMRLMSSST
ncbi:MAG: hypothetical protein JWQ17_5683 [Tardiphaga sp.]|nr:hypothetical protein [Tardiphaga sp.]